MAGSEISNRMLPEGELSCIWVAAGLVSYKLCDRNLECDECPFDIVMRQKSKPPKAPSHGEKGTTEISATKEMPVTGAESLAGMMDELFAPPGSTTLPDDRMYSSNHVWLKEVRKGVYRVGLDHYAVHFMGHIGSIIFPREGTNYSAGDPVAWIVSNGGTVPILSPLTGKVININSTLKEVPQVMRRDPYNLGWLGEIIVLESKGRSVGFINSTEALPRYETQLSRLKQEIVSHLDRGGGSLGRTLPDGGFHPTCLEDVLGAQEYALFLRKLLTKKS